MKGTRSPGTPRLDRRLAAGGLLPLLLAVGLGVSWALPPDRAISQYNIDIWQVGRGLPHNAVMAIRQTADGFLWLGTLEGLVRFDGHRFSRPAMVTFDLQRTDVRALVQDAAGWLWAGTRDGRLIGQSGGDVRWVAGGQLPGGAIRALARAGDGGVWVGTERGLAYLPAEAGGGGQPVSILIGQYVCAVLEDRQGTLWVGTQRSGLLRRVGGQFESVSLPVEGLPWVSSLLEDGQGRILVGALSDGVFGITGDRIDRWELPAGVPTRKVNCLLEDRHGRLWIGGDGAGLFRLEETGEFSQLDQTAGLPSQYIYSLFEDATGGLWVGTASGVVRLSAGPVVAYNRQQGLPHDSADVVWYAPDGSPWLAMVGSVFRLVKTGGSVALPRLLDRWRGHRVSSLHLDSQGEVWAGTWKGAVIPPTGYPVWDLAGRFGAGKVRCAWQTGDGAHWFGSDTGLVRLAEGKAERVSLGAEPASNDVWAMVEDRKGRFWVGTRAGLVLVAGRHGVANLGVADGLPSAWVHSLYPGADGLLWVGTETGLAVIRENRPARMDRAAPSLRERVFSIQGDAEGCLWLGTPRGLVQVSKSELLQKPTGPVIERVFTEEDGLPSRICSGQVIGAAGRSDARFIWVPTLGGLVRVDTASLGRASDPPSPVVIGQVTVDGVEFKGEFDSGAAPLALPAGSGRLEIRYTVPLLKGADRLVFRYWLEGFDPDWVEAGSERLVQYTNLAPGQYTFQVASGWAGGAWGPPSPPLPIRLAPHFYQNPWVILAVTGGMVAGVLSMHRLRLRQLRRRERELGQQVDARTRDLQDALGNVRAAHEHLRQAQAMLEEKNRHTEDSIRYARRIQESVLPAPDRLAEVFPEHFLISMPRETVSGDFFWLHREGGRRVLAVADCTGHGVPGALLSTIGSMLLDQIVREGTDLQAAVVVGELNIRVRAVLQQYGDGQRSMDGMDVALCVLDDQRGTLSFCGAGRPLYLLRSHELVELSGNRASVGGRQRERTRSFTERMVFTRSGDLLVLASDGFSDQHDPKGRKFGSRRFKMLLQEVAGQKLAEQRQALLEALDEHRGAEEQRDDITVLAVRL